MKIKRILYYLTLWVILSGLSSCYPKFEDPTNEDLDVSLTIYDKTYYVPSGINKFQDFKTFVVPDTIVHIVDTSSPDTLTRSQDQFIIDQVKTNLIKAGYTEETNPSAKPPDIAVTLTVSTSSYISYDWYSYWEWYWPADSKGISAVLSSSGHYYTWYPPIYGLGSTYSYVAGTLVMEMIEVARIDPATEVIPAVWAGLVNGATGGPEEGLQDRLSAGIDQCFEQSPYLTSSKP
jgi:hypothetical protein